jgi:branched-chain amino acid transport system ATP-binding protein
MILKVENLVKHFSGLTALNQVNLEIQQGEIVGIIGPNGSGKTTLFNCLTKYLQPDEGVIYFQGENITGLKPYQVAIKGITRNFQLARSFKDLSVMENMLIFAQEHQERGIFSRLIWTRQVRRFEKAAYEKAMEIIQFMNLEHLIFERAGNLSGGQQKILSIAQCLMADPKILLLDEPTAAINPTLILEIMERLKKLNRGGQTILIIEHNIDVVMELCHRVVVLNYGDKIAEGLPTEIRQNPEVIDAYFGG